MRLVRLEPFEAADIGRLAGWIDRPEALFEWTGSVFDFPLDATQLTRHLGRAARGPHPDRLFRIVATATEAVIGHIEITRTDPRNRACRIERALIGEGEYRGLGYGADALSATLRVAFHELGVHRVEAEIAGQNRPALRSFERCGFQREGERRDALRAGRAYCTMVLLGILEDEWR